MALFDQGVAAGHRFRTDHKATWFAFQSLHCRQVCMGHSVRKLHSLAAARASHALAVLTHWNISPSCKPRALGALSFPVGWHHIQQSG
jgi:hypothetical protein